MFYYLRANNDTVNAKLDALLAATQDGHGPHHQVDLSVYDKALYPPEDPKEVWEFNFERENKIPVDYFIEWFAAEYIPVSAPGLGVTKLSEEEQRTLIALVDAFPTDGKVSFIEFKRFCRQVAMSKMTMHSFLQTLATGSI